MIHQDTIKYWLYLYYYLLYKNMTPKLIYLKNCMYVFRCYLFWLRWVFVALCGLSLVAANRGCSLLCCTGFTLWWLFRLWRLGCKRACSGVSACVLQGVQLSVLVAHKLSSCSTRAPELHLVGFRVWAQQLLYRLSCSAAHGIFPDQRIKPKSSASAGVPPGNSPHFFLFFLQFTSLCYFLCITAIPITFHSNKIFLKIEVYILFS